MKKLGSAFKFVALLLGLGAIVVAIVGIAVQSGDSTIKGTEAFFGATFADLGVLGSAKMKFNIIGVAILAAILVGTILGVAGGKIGAVIGAVLLIGGGVGLFLFPEYTNIIVKIAGFEKTNSLASLDYKIAWGTITGGSLACASGLLSALGILK